MKSVRLEVKLKGSDNLSFWTKMVRHAPIPIDNQEGVK